MTNKFFKKLKEFNLAVSRFNGERDSYFVGVEELEKAWESGRLEFVDKPAVSIHEVLERACGRGSNDEDWLKLRDEVHKRGVIFRG